MATDNLEPDRCARLLKAMADPERLKIVQFLRGGPKNVGEIAAELGVEMVNVSHHLGVLRNAGIAIDERQGRYIVYRLHPDIFQSPPEKGESEHLNFGCCRLEIPPAKARSTKGPPPKGRSKRGER
jgi:DNA-binding transcriptional ArsR family regulator